METLLNLQAQRQSDIVSYRPQRGQAVVEIPLISASTVVQSASALLNVFSALAGDQEMMGFDKHVADEFAIQRNGLELRVSLYPHLDSKEMDAKNRVFRL